MKEKRFLHTRKTPHKQGQGKGASEPQREAQRDRRAKGKTEKLHFGSYVAHTLVASRGWVWRLRPRDWSSVRGMGVDYHEGTLRLPSEFFTSCYCSLQGAKSLQNVKVPPHLLVEKGSKE